VNVGGGTAGAVRGASPPPGVPKLGRVMVVVPPSTETPDMAGGPVVRCRSRRGRGRAKFLRGRWGRSRGRRLPGQRLNLRLAIRCRDRCLCRCLIRCHCLRGRFLPCRSATWRWRLRRLSSAIRLSIRVDWRLRLRCPGRFLRHSSEELRRNQVERTSGSCAFVAASAAGECFASAETWWRRDDVGGTNESACGMT